MAYLDQLKGLSSPDLAVQVSAMSSIAAIVKEDPSPLLLNTVAINVATKFVSAPNRLRLFIAKVRVTQFFLECAVEMQMLKSKREVLELLTSVLDTNDVLAQMMMLRILGALAPVLSTLLDIQHKVLLAVDSKYQRVREMALAVLPAMLPSTPNLARHVFHKDLPDTTLLALCRSCPDDEEAVTRAFSLCCRKLSGERLVQALASLALRSSHVIVRTVGDI